MRAPSVNLEEAEFRDRVFACWLGKNVGGTLGMPFEGQRQTNSVDYYTDIKPGEPAANDDLDLQLLWLKAMQDHGGAVDARILGEYWLKHIPVDWNEYGICKANMRLGLVPPLSGEFRNEEWKHSNGAWIRTEIWACLAPGSPAEAARMAREDACVDHGAAEGTLAAMFVAAIESAAFVEKDRGALLAIGLSFIRYDSELARSVRAVMTAHAKGNSWEGAREAALAASERTGWFQAPRNVAFAVLGWLYGRDFGDAICTAVNCGDDTDCTGATLGSLLGILGGTKAIPARWSDPIGRQIKTVAISGFDNVSNLDDLTNQTVAMAKRVASDRKLPVAIGPGPTDFSRAATLKLIDIGAAKRLWKLSPYSIVWREKGMEATLDYGGPPTLAAGKVKSLKVTVTGRDGSPLEANCSIAKLPSAWRCRVTGGLVKGAFRIAITPTKDLPDHNLLAVEVGCAGRSIKIPLALFSETP